MPSINDSANEINNTYLSFEGVSQTVVKWGARIIVVSLAGYYSLGVAYQTGLMAKIDQYAIKIFLHFFGYAGLGAFMPTFQWYSAWGVRFAAAFTAVVIWDLTVNIASYAATKFKNKFSSQPSLQPVTS